MTGNKIQRWSDKAMFASESHDASTGPKVALLAGTPDPLGAVAACAKMYVGEVVRDLADVTDDERRHYLAEMQKTKLAMPMEAISLHFMLENVTRAFTHQLVRQRTAAYAQESMRFAVVEDMTQAVALPPSLAVFNDPLVARQAHSDRNEGFMPTDLQRQYLEWTDAIDQISDSYSALVNSGMPAEDARGLMPTNIVTRVNYLTNFRGLLDHAGNRLCTQAQFEWRSVFAQIVSAMREYGQRASYIHTVGDERFQESSAWQWEALAALLQPVCYQTGKCAFGADFDRACSIRGRVDANAKAGVPSSKWGEKHWSDGLSSAEKSDVDGAVFIGAIHPREWLADPGAARVAH